MVCGTPGERVGRGCGGLADLAPILIEEYDPGVSGPTGDRGQAQGLCAYCANASDDLTEDHVIPRAWSGNAEAAAAPKLKVPACRPCNNRFSKVERELGTGFGLTTWTDDELMGDLAASAARSVKPSAARNEKDRQGRLLAMRKLQHTQILPWSVVDEHPDSVLMGTVVDRSQQFAIKLSGEALHTMAEKIARGVWFSETGSPVKSGYAVSTQPVRGTCPPELHQLFEQHGTELRIGRSTVIRYAPMPDDPATAMFEIRLWARLTIFAFIVAPGHDERVAHSRRGPVL